MLLSGRTTLIWLAACTACFGLTASAKGAEQGRGTQTAKSADQGRESQSAKAAEQGGEAETAKDDQQASEPSPPTASDRIMVVGTIENLETIPGSASRIEGSTLLRAQAGFGDIHRILRSVPGVNIQEEDGFGLRPNIGFRGSGSERSAGITLMEDGVLIAPAPYAAPAAYYFPTPGRMEAVEVRKGSSQIKFGPRTNGGVLNLVSTRVPDQLRVFGELGGGTSATGKARLTVGGGSSRWGWLLETYQMRSQGYKHIDGGGDAGFQLSDLVGKARYRTDATSSTVHEIELKFGYTTQRSNETYLGLTDADFAIDPMRRYAGSQGDRLDAEHRQLQLRHFTVLGDSLDLTTVIYRNDFNRDWYKIQSVNRVGIDRVLQLPGQYAEELGILRGADSNPSAIAQRHNNRVYYGQGIQSVVGLRLGRGTLRHHLEIGMRYHADQEDRLQSEDGYQMIGGRKQLNSVGVPGSQSNRIGSARAWAFFAHDRIAVGDFAITPGVRFESIDMTRIDYAPTDLQRSSPSRVRESRTNVLVPGVGVDHRISNRSSVFAGAHRGFAPPGPGSAAGVEPETSINYELGYRYRAPRTSTSLTGFFNNYDNLLGADTLSSGGQGTGDLFNGGAAHVWGMELAAQHTLGTPTGSALSVPISLAYTWTRGTFRTSFDSEFEPWGNVRTGDEMPYLAEHHARLSLGLQTAGWDLFAAVNAGGAMRTEPGQGSIPVGSGTDAFAAVDLSASYRIGDRVRLHAAMQNVLDSTYVVARRPAGARPGLPRTVFLNLSFNR